MYENLMLTMTSASSLEPNSLHAETGRRKVRVAIIGVGNCASAIVQGVQFYRAAPENEAVPGLMHVNLGGYHISDIEFSAAFDIDENKVGKDLAEAITAPPNNTIRFADVPTTSVIVQRGNTLDGLGKYVGQRITEASGAAVDVARILKETRTDVVVSYLPVGSEQATQWYVEQVLAAGCGMVNCIPVFIASQPHWQQRFRERGVADHRRRHQVAGWRDDHTSHAGEFVSRARGAARPDLPVELRWQHRFPKHARARAAGFEENLQDQRCDQPARRADVGGQRARRPERLRAVARGPQMVPHPHGGNDLRQRAFEMRSQARGLGLTELSWSGDRCGALHQACARPGYQWPARRAVQLLHEVAAGAMHRPRGA